MTLRRSSLPVLSIAWIIAGPAAAGTASPLIGDVEQVCTLAPDNTELRGVAIDDVSADAPRLLALDGSGGRAIRHGGVIRADFNGRGYVACAGYGCLRNCALINTLALASRHCSGGLAASSARLDGTLGALGALAAHRTAALAASAPDVRPACRGHGV